MNGRIRHIGSQMITRSLSFIASMSQPIWNQHHPSEQHRRQWSKCPKPTQARPVFLAGAGGKTLKVSPYVLNSQFDKLCSRRVFSCYAYSLVDGNLFKTFLRSYQRLCNPLRITYLPQTKSGFAASEPEVKG